MGSIFNSFAETFPLASNEDERWAREQELLLPCCPPDARVLDLACGSGFHARHLAAAGRRVVAMDLAADALDAARTLPHGDRVTWQQGDLLQPIEGTFDTTLLLGNTLSLFDRETELRQIFAHVAHALTPQGRLLVQVIDYDYLREHPVHIRRQGDLQGAPVTFDKRLEATDEGALITITETRGGQSASETQPLHAWPLDALQRLALAAGLEPDAAFGGLSGEAYKPGASKDVVALFRKGPPDQS